jgi:hypothetical protein
MITLYTNIYMGRMFKNGYYSHSIVEGGFELMS